MAFEGVEDRLLLGCIIMLGIIKEALKHTCIELLDNQEVLHRKTFMAILMSSW